MALHLEAPPAALPPAPSVVAQTSDTVGDYVVGVLHYLGLALPARPQGAQPTLVGAPLSLGMDDADRLHGEASRWLEYVEGILAVAEARHLVSKGELEREEKRLAFIYKKKDYLTALQQDEFDHLQDLSRKEVELHATVIAISGMRDAINKVVAKASRTITRLSKTNPAGF